MSLLLLDLLPAPDFLPSLWVNHPPILSSTLFFFFFFTSLFFSSPFSFSLVQKLKAGGWQPEKARGFPRKVSVLPGRCTYSSKTARHERQLRKIQHDAPPPMLDVFFSHPVVFSLNPSFSVFLSDFLSLCFIPPLSSLSF